MYSELKGLIMNKILEVTDEEIDSLINGLACAYNESQEKDTDLEMTLTVKLKELRNK